jgi:hypothetical protein
LVLLINFVAANVLIPLTNFTGMNTIAYIVYLLITYVITVRVGFIFYRNGRVFILSLLHGDVQLTDFINRILLTGYYLLNLGYATVMLSTWDTILTWRALVLSIVVMTGKIMLTLAVVHFCNMVVIYLISKRNQHFLNSKI